MFNILYQDDLEKHKTHNYKYALSVQLLTRAKANDDLSIQIY